MTSSVQHGLKTCSGTSDHEVPKKIVPDTIIKKNGRGGENHRNFFFETGTFLKSELFFGPELFLSESDFFLSKDYLPVLPSSAKKEKKIIYHDEKM